MEEVNLLEDKTDKILEVIDVGKDFFNRIPIEPASGNTSN